MSILQRAAGVAQDIVAGAVGKAIEMAPDRMIPGGVPDPLLLKRHGAVGRPVSRIDGPLKVAGAARFAAEFAPEGMVYASVLCGTVAKGRIAALQVAGAEAAPGVVLVMTYRNMPRLKPMQRFMDSPLAVGGDDLPVMQDDRLHWSGQPVAVVLASTQEQADHAASLIEVEYAAEAAVTDFRQACSVDGGPATFEGEPMLTTVGDAEAALAASPHKVDATYETPHHAQAAIEPHALTVLWEGDVLRIHDASQSVDHVAWSLATMFGIDKAQVRVTSPYVGGGFGSKLLWQHQVLGAAAAKLSSRPVRLALSREGVFRTVGGRSRTVQRVAVGADEAGRFTAIVHTGFSAMPEHSSIPEPFIRSTRSTYAARTFKLDVKAAELDILANFFMRGPGEAVGTLALECAIDELAHATGMDPIELRLRNEPERDPVKGTPWSMRNLEYAYRMGAERFGWGERRPPGTRRDGRWLVGVGCATGTYPYHRMPGGAARITLTRAGTASVDVAAHEMGMGTATAQTQVAADRLGLPLDRVAFNYGDSTLPGVVMAGGSQQTVVVGASVMAAYDALKAELIRLAGNDSPLAGLSADEVEGADGGLVATGDASRTESYGSILARAGRDEVVAEAEASKPTEDRHWSMHSYSANFAEVRVDAVTGETRVSRLLGAFDCGRIINPKTAASQFRGAMIMGIGLALMEAVEFDARKGRIMNPSLAEYHMPVHLDVPALEVMWTDLPDPHAPMGAHGVGEIGITGTGAAIANAVFNATGKRVRDFPLTLDKVL